MENTKYSVKNTRKNIYTIIQTYPSFRKSKKTKNY